MPKAYLSVLMVCCFIGLFLLPAYQTHAISAPGTTTILTFQKIVDPISPQFSLDTGGVGYNGSLVGVVDDGQLEIPSGILLFDRNGNFQQKIAENNLTTPTDVHFFQDKILVSQRAGYPISIYDTAGTFKKGIGSFGENTGEFDFPRRMDDNGTHLFIADSGLDEVIILNSSLNYVSSISSTVDVQLSLVTDVAVDNQFVYVLDQGVNDGGNNDRIYIFNHLGEFVKEVGEGLFPDDSLSFDHSNGFFYIGSGDSLIVIDVNDNYHGKIASEVNNQTIITALNDITVFNDKLFATDLLKDHLLLVDVDVSNFVVNSGNDNIRLSWTGPFSFKEDKITHFNIYRGTSPRTMDLIARLASSEFTYIDYNIEFNRTYYYAVSALNMLGETPLSQVEQASVKNPVTATQTVTSTETTEIIASESGEQGRLSLPIETILLSFSAILLLKYRRYKHR